MKIPGLIQAEEYDLGGEGVGYSDSSGGNKQGVSRSLCLVRVSQGDRNVGGVCGRHHTKTFCRLGGLYRYHILVWGRFAAVFVDHNVVGSRVDTRYSFF